VLYVCIPAYNEAPTIGLLLWRIRKVFQEYSREYEIVVFNDGSTDDTAAVLQPYHDVLPLTVIGGTEHVGYAAALDALARTVSQRTRYPRRDAMITLQADFTDSPDHLPELAKRFEGGADIVVAERDLALLPAPVRRLRRLAPWAVRPAPAVPGVKDPFGSLRAYRITVIRDLVRAFGNRPIVDAAGWGANVQLLVRAAAYARRIDTLPLDAQYDLRPRESRIRPWSDALGLFRTARSLRATTRAAAPAGPAATPGSATR
jgi:glycosyltransferase involved in cell wall biosynthesis